MIELKRMTVPVADLEEAAVFYRDLLGMDEITSDFDVSSERRYECGDHELRLTLGDDDVQFGCRFGVVVDDIHDLLARAASENWIAREGEHDLV
jgi:catechol 2,3-dioxygenase-like lactoylglutathione lyase family enzyme